jgi:hypothetical protein
VHNILYTQMRSALLTVITLWSIHPSLGQGIEKILVVSQAGDEPPTKPAPAKYTMAFEINPDEDFIATQFKRDNKRCKLSEAAKIEKRRIEQVGEWNAVKKVDFTPLDVGIDRKMIASAIENSDHKINFGLPDEIVLDVDSFHFC